MSARRSPRHYVEVLLRQAHVLGLDTQAIQAELGLHAAGIGAEWAEGAWIDNAVLAKLVKWLWRQSNNETMGFDPTPLRPGTWAVACEYMLCGDTLGELLRRGEKVMPFLAPASLALHLRSSRHAVALHINMYVGPRDPQHYLAEFVTAVWHRFPSWVIDQNIQLSRAFFSYAAPPHARLYEEMFQCEVRFEQAHCGFEFHRRYLKKPVIRTRQELQTWLRDSPADLLYMPGRESSVQAHLRGELLAALRDSRPFPGFELICRRLHMSPQVVRRRLAEENTSYQKIKDTIRRDTAQRLLQNPDIPVAAIAERTGFSETAAFSRAFKKWTGLTPAAFRAARD